ncbi:MAG: hypothetical protein JNL01_14405 [Bdellovibrionales bacterium]|nr:hypothetical protein [Bdellovibrionales bacterium]
MRFKALSLSVWLGLATASCNIFAPFDAPSGDEQYLSAARACFDVGDYDCARDYYAKLTGTSYQDIRISETAFTIFDEEGADIGAVMGGSITGGDYGKTFTVIANRMMNKGSGPTEARRLKIFNAFRTAKDISSTQLQGLVRFMGAAALAAELLGEDALNLGQTAVSQSTLVDTPASCTSAGNACAGALDASCLKTGTILVVGATIDLWATVAPTMSGAPTLDMVSNAMSQVQAGLSQIGVSGSYGSQLSAFGSALTAFTIPAEGADCFRLTLLEQKVGQ